MNTVYICFRGAKFWELWIRVFLPVLIPGSFAASSVGQEPGALAPQPTLIPASAPLSGEHAWPRPEGVIPVTQFGAVGDGVADDTPAVEQAIRLKGSVFFPKGIYRLTRTVEIYLPDTGFVSLWGDGTARIVMSGSGPAFRFVGTHKGTASPNTVRPELWERERMPVVSGLEIIGDHPEAGGIEATGTMMLVLRDLLIRETFHAIRLYIRNRNVLIANCNIYKNRGIGVYLDDCNLHQINITGCHISYNEGGGIVSRAGDVRNIQVTGCDIESNMPLDPAVAEASPPTANILIEATDGSAGTAEVAITGCTIQHTHQANDSANIRFIGTDAKGRAWGHLVIANNVLSDVQVNIDLRNARGVSIVGNTFWQGGQWNLRAIDCEQLLVGPNLMDRNPHYESQLSGDDALLFVRCRDITITGLHVNGPRRKEAGAIFEECKGVHIFGATFLDCEGNGLLLRNCSDVRVSQCWVRPPQGAPPSWLPVRVEGGEKIVISSEPQ